MSTPRTDALDARYGHRTDGERMVRFRIHARELEEELNRHRAALESLAYFSLSRTETRQSLRDRIADHLRDLERPTPETLP